MSFGLKSTGGFLIPENWQSYLWSHSSTWQQHPPRDAPANCGIQHCSKELQREAGSRAPSSNAQLQHAQQFSILSAIFCSTELVVCIELVFIFPNMIYKHNHVSDFDIALGSTASMHPGPSSAGWGAPRLRRRLQWEYSKCEVRSCPHQPPPDLPQPHGAKTRSPSG